MYPISQFSDDSFGACSSNSEKYVKKPTKTPTATMISLISDDELSSPRVFSRESDLKFTNSLIVNNDKIRYYYNKTLCLKAHIDDMLGQLEKLHSSTFEYLAQFPETGDYSIIRTLFELIPTVATLVDWSSLNQPCYWDDFCRETKQLSYLVDKVNGAALRCSDTASDVLAQVNEIFSGLAEPTQRLLNTDRALSYRKLSDYTNDNPENQCIQLQWRKPGDVIELEWHDADGGLMNVALSQTGLGFRLRFLRHIIYHARSLLADAYLTFLKLNVSLQLQLPIEKLAKCEDVDMKKLSQQEKACLTKAKREFDGSLDNIWKMSARFKFQTFQLYKYDATLKGMRKSKKYAPNTAPSFMKVVMNVDDSLLMRMITSVMQAQALQESFDFTVYPDRTEDVIDKIEDLLAVDMKTFLVLQKMLALIKIIFPKEKKNLSKKEQASVNNEIEMIFAHRFRIRRWLKQSTKLLETHWAFKKMDKLKLLLGLKVSKSEYGINVGLNESGETIQSHRNSAESHVRVIEEHNNNVVDTDNEEENWITLEGKIKITYTAIKGMVTQFPYKDGVQSYSELSGDEKVIVCIRLIRQLLIYMAYEQCWAKVSFERISETKSLVKRLKMTDRLEPDLQNVLVEQQKYLRKMLKLTKAMRFLKK